MLDNSIAICPANDGVILMSSKVGVPPGMHSSTILFNHVYHKALSEYYANDEGATSLLKACSPVAGAQINMAHTSFVDDVCTTVATHEASQLPKMATQISNALDTAFSKHGFVQNQSKGMSISKAYGRGSHKVMTQLATQQDVGLRTLCRYLGPQLQWSGTNKAEIRQGFDRAGLHFVHLLSFGRLMLHSNSNLMSIRQLSSASCCRQHKR